MGAQDLISGETTCGSLLQQLQLIWDEVGETDDERDKKLLQLEQECLDVYRKKVDQASKSRALLLQSLADLKAEFARLLSALGETSVVAIPETSSGTIKEQLTAIAPVLEHLRIEKGKRIKEFAVVQTQIQRISGEIAGDFKTVEIPKVNEDDLSVKKLDEYYSQLQELQKEKSKRLHTVHEFASTIHAFCAVLGMDFFSTITEVHPSLNDSHGVQSKSISDNTLTVLSKTVLALREEKKLRLEKLQELASQLSDLWKLMDTPVQEQNLFGRVTCNISASFDDVTIPGALAIDLIEQAEIEVERLDQLKASKMKEIAFKKQAELETIYACAHKEIDIPVARAKITSLIDSGTFEPSELLIDLDNQILKAKDEALSRKEILEKVEKWMSACEEESWLEDYNQDERRYNSSRGAHVNLKRAEKARVLVNKIPALVDALVAKTRAWEEDHGFSFTYDGVPLLVMLDEYTLLRRDREEEKRRMRDQKKFQEQLSTEQEAIFGTRPSPARSVGSKNAMGTRANCGGLNGTPGQRLPLNTHHQNGVNGVKSAGRDGRRDNARPAAPANYVAIPKEEAMSHIFQQ